MTARALSDLSRRLRDAAGRAYVAQRTEQSKRVDRRETDQEVREALARHGWVVAEGAS